MTTETAHRFCPLCGSQNETQWKFCVSCGKELPGLGGPTTTSVQSDAPADAVTNPDVSGSAVQDAEAAASSLDAIFEHPVGPTAEAETPPSNVRAFPVRTPSEQGPDRLPSADVVEADGSSFDDEVDNEIHRVAATIQRLASHSDGGAALEPMYEEAPPEEATPGADPHEAPGADVAAEDGVAGKHGVPDAETAEAVQDREPDHDLDRAIDADLADWDAAGSEDLAGVDAHTAHVERQLRADGDQEGTPTAAPHVENIDEEEVSQTVASEPEAPTSEPSVAAADAAEPDADDFELFRSLDVPENLPEPRPLAEPARPATSEPPAVAAPEAEPTPLIAAGAAPYQAPAAAAVAETELVAATPTRGTNQTNAPTTAAATPTPTPIGAAAPAADLEIVVSADRSTVSKLERGMTTSTIAAQVATLTTALFGLGIVALLYTLNLRLDRSTTTNDTGPAETIDRYLTFGAQPLMLIAVFAALIALLRWTTIAYSAAWTSGRTQFTIARRTATIAWPIPIANLLLPPLAMHGLWRAARPDDGRPNPWIVLWPILLGIGAFITVVAALITPTGLDQSIRANTFSAMGFAIMTIGFVCLSVAISSVSDAQRQFLHRVHGRAGGFTDDDLLSRLGTGS